jgi:ABC-type molybdenum transport system ATPase subunit/photorepair protein PhrA
MIVGLLLRHYKTYQGLYFIPICNDYKNKYSLFVGNNGVGKSSIMEGLNTFFNNSGWNKNKTGKKNEAFLAPLFLIKKETLEEKVSNKNAIDFISFLSDYFWDVRQDINPSFSSEEYNKFFRYRDELKHRYKKEDYYFFLIGVEFENKNKVFFSSFTKFITNNIPDELKGFGHDELLNIIRNLYSYIYIPVETTTSSVLKIENQEMQELMSTDILNKIDSILNLKNFSEGRKSISVIDFLNISLNEYIESINEIISEIDESYAFKVEGQVKKKLTSTDVRTKILEAFFSIRTLKKDKKEISELSSGEQRIALIDVATAFLLESENKSRMIILAIDEPENSLHISNAFKQFERLQLLSVKNQLLLTTHWYGSLPITDTGSLQFLEKEESTKVSINTYDLNNYFEKRGNLPEDIIIKSYFELTSSILSSMRADNTNWIICEGSDDKLYLDYYLSNIPNLKILAVGGCGNVVKLYKYLSVPFSEKDENKSLNSKVLCLVDTDDVLNIIESPSEINNKLKIARMQIDREQNTVLLNKLIKSGYYKPTEIEDCLDPKTLYDAVVKSIEQYGTMEQRDAIVHFTFNEEMKVSIIKSEKSIFKPTTLEGFEQKQLIYDFIDDQRNKYLVARNYIEETKTKHESFAPPLFTSIRSYFID